jgi:hypothetical protein
MYMICSKLQRGNSRQTTHQRFPAPHVPISAASPIESGPLIGLPGNPQANYLFQRVNVASSPTTKRLISSAVRGPSLVRGKFG